MNVKGNRHLIGPKAVMLTLACVALCAVSACSSSSASGDGDGSNNPVVAAAQKTSSASSYSFDQSISTDGSNFPSHGLYEAPDRMSVTYTDGPAGTVPTATIVIGDDRYESDPRNPDQWTELTVPGAGMFDLVQVLDMAERATNVTQSSDGTYTFSSRTCSGDEVQGTAKLTRDGYLSEVHTAFVIGGHPTTMDQSFAKFGKPANIQPPDPSKVRASGTVTPTAGAIVPSTTCVN
ncbi:MAG: hypothetical protein ACJ768_04685 [Gaiellaceae bacterium]